EDRSRRRRERERDPPVTRAPHYGDPLSEASPADGSDRGQQADQDAGREYRHREQERLEVGRRQKPASTFPAAKWPDQEPTRRNVGCQDGKRGGAPGGLVGPEQD